MRIVTIVVNVDTTDIEFVCSSLDKANAYLTNKHKNCERLYNEEENWTEFVDGIKYRYSIQQWTVE